MFCSIFIYFTFNFVCFCNIIFPTFVSNEVFLSENVLRDMLTNEVVDKMIGIPEMLQKLQNDRKTIEKFEKTTKTFNILYQKHEKN